MRDGFFGFPMIVGNITRGESSSPKPALKRPEPLSKITAGFIDMFYVFGFELLRENVGVIYIENEFIYV